MKEKLVRNKPWVLSDILNPKSTYYLLLFLFILSSLWIIKSIIIQNKAWSFTPGVFVCSIRDGF